MPDSLRDSQLENNLPQDRCWTCDRAGCAESLKQANDACDTAYAAYKAVGFSCRDSAGIAANEALEQAFLHRNSVRNDCDSHAVDWRGLALQAQAELVEMRVEAAKASPACSPWTAHHGSAIRRQLGPVMLQVNFGKPQGKDLIQWTCWTGKEHPIWHTAESVEAAKTSAETAVLEAQ